MVLNQDKAHDKKFTLTPKTQKNPCHHNIHENNSCGDKEVVLNVDNAEEICANENVSVKISYQNMIIFFKPKM